MSGTLILNLLIAAAKLDLMKKGRGVAIPLHGALALNAARLQVEHRLRMADSIAFAIYRGHRALSRSCDRHHSFAYAQ